MRPALRTLIASTTLAFSLTACDAGTETTSAADPTRDAGDNAAATASASPSVATKEPAWTEVQILDLTSAGGTVTTELQALATPQQVDDFLSGLDSPEAARRVRQAVGAAEVPPGHTLMGAVVAQGCEPPTSVMVDTGSGTPTVDVDLPQRNLQCFAAVTSVALVSVRADLIS